MPCPYIWTEAGKNVTKKSHKCHSGCLQQTTHANERNGGKGIRPKQKSHLQKQARKDTASSTQVKSSP